MQTNSADRLEQCFAQKLGATNLVECLSNKPSCQWHLPFGKGMLCRHPLNQEIAKGEFSSGWANKDSDATQLSRPMP